MILKKNKAAKTIQKAYKKHKELQPILKFLQSKKFEDDFDYTLENAYDYVIYLEEEKGIYDADNYLTVKNIVKAITSKDKKFKNKIISIIEDLAGLSENEILMDIMFRKFPDLENFGINELVDMIKGEYVPKYD